MGLSDVDFLLGHDPQDQEALETFVAWTSKFNGRNTYWQAVFKHIRHNLRWFFFGKGALAMMDSAVGNHSRPMWLETLPEWPVTKPVKHDDDFHRRVRRQIKGL